MKLIKINKIKKRITASLLAGIMLISGYSIVAGAPQETVVNTTVPTAMPTSNPLSTVMPSQETTATAVPTAAPTAVLTVTPTAVPTATATPVVTITSTPAATGAVVQAPEESQDNNIMLQVGQIWEIPSLSGRYEWDSLGDAIAKVEEEKIIQGISIYDHLPEPVEGEPSENFLTEVNGEIKITDAEFKVSASGDKWKIFNEKTNSYLTNLTDSSTYFSADSADMQFTCVGEGSDTKFRISSGNMDRYMVFDYSAINFNGKNGEYSDEYENGSYEFVLLEKCEAVSDTDILPGYTHAEAIKDGGVYLITYICKDGSIILLYPTNGENNQTKLVKADTKTILRVTGISEGTVSLTVDDCVYTIVVQSGAVNPTPSVSITPTPAPTLEKIPFAVYMLYGVGTFSIIIATVLYILRKIRLGKVR